MAESKWNDINDPRFFKSKPKKEESNNSKPNTGVEEDDSPRPKPKPQYRFVSIKPVEPETGFEQNKPYTIEGTVEKIASVEKITLTRVLMNPIGTYKDDVDELNPPGVEAFIDVATNKFSATCKYLFTHHLWPRNPDEAVNQTWEMFVRATGAGAENPLDSDKVILPQKSKFVLLQKGDYDNKGAEKYNKPKSGDQYKPGVKGNLVTSLQNDLITTEYLPKDSADGFFGDQTETALREFQKHAIGSLRMKRKTGKHEKAERLLEQPSPDGIVGKKTRDQLDWWLSQGFIIPKPTLRQDDYDDDGVKKRLGVKGGEDHHQSYVVSDSQRSLDSAGAQPGKIDGWFGPKMKQAVELFQESAQRGEFLIGGVLTKLEKKLERFVKGEMDQKTREYLEMVVGKGGKVADDSLLVRFSNTLELERQDILSSKSKNILGHAARNVGYESIEITSTIRYPKQQAEAMYTNLENKKRLQYAAPGMAVTAVYDDGKQNGFDKTTIIQKMENKIIALSKEGKRVSKHCVGLEIYKKTNIVDINIPTTKVKEFIMELAKNNSVEKIFHDILDIKDEGKISRLAKEPCIHVEIKQ